MLQEGCLVEPSIDRTEDNLQVDGGAWPGKNLCPSEAELAVSRDRDSFLDLVKVRLALVQKLELCADPLRYVKLVSLSVVHQDVEVEGTPRV